MKILQIIPSLGVGGAETMMCNLSCELVKNGDEVVVVVFALNDSIIKERLINNRIKIISLEKNVGFSPKTIFRIKKIIKEENPDIIHTHLHVLPYVWLACGKKKIIHTLHSIAKKEQSGIGKYICGFIYCYSEKCIPVAISEQVRKSMINEYNLKRKIPVVCNGVPIENIISKSSYEINNSAHIFHVGRFTKFKNHKMMVDALERIKTQEENVILHFYGTGELEDEIKEVVRDKGLESAVKFEGVCPNISKILINGDIFVLPSEYEGMPMSLIEAMAAGLPCIASEVGGIPDMIENGYNGILINSNIDNLVNAVIDLLRNKDKRKQLGMNARKDAKKYSAHNMMDEYLSIYK